MFPKGPSVQGRSLLVTENMHMGHMIFFCSFPIPATSSVMGSLYDDGLSLEEAPEQCGRLIIDSSFQNSGNKLTLPLYKQVTSGIMAVSPFSTSLTFVLL